MEQKAIISLRGISKQFPGVLALDDVSFDVYEGETMALVGENGAGKSTLIKVLAGAHYPTSGQFVIDGNTYDGLTPDIADELGISVIYQEFNLMDTLSVAENVYMGRYPMKHGMVDYKKMREDTKKIFDSMNVDIDPTAIVADLSTAYMQLVEIAKSISKNLKILIMDEPTAPLTTAEVDVLFRIMKNLKERGVTILFISHRLQEVFDVCDRVTILRDGKWISTERTADTTKAKLVLGMVGREISDSYPKRDFEIGETVLKVRNLCGNGVKNVSFDLHRGEILGFSGLVGAGRTEIMRILFGADHVEGGEVEKNGKPLKIKNPSTSIDNGIVLIPEDRKKQGVLLGLPIGQNIALPNLRKISSKGGVMSRSKEKEMVDEQISNLKVSCYGSQQLVGTLSGGNQQKIVLAKWLAGDADIFIFDEPTRGIDVGAKQEIYNLMNEFCRQGKAVIMISSEMEEMLGMADRVVVLYEGKQTGILEKDQITQERILRLASGESEELA